MGNKKYYNNIFKENRCKAWDDAPGKKVILEAVNHLVKQRSNTIIDIGCGSGYFINEIKKHNSINKYESKYYGVDISEEAIIGAKSRYPEIVFRVMNAIKLDLDDEYFDIVSSYGVIEHILTPQKALFEVNRILKTGGLFFILLPSLDYYRNDRVDEGWYQDLDSCSQFQWNYLRETWERMFAKANLNLLNIKESIKYGALKPGVFFFGQKKTERK